MRLYLRNLLHVQQHPCTCPLCEIVRSVVPGRPSENEWLVCPFELRVPLCSPQFLHWKPGWSPYWRPALRDITNWAPRIQWDLHEHVILAPLKGPPTQQRKNPSLSDINPFGTVTSFNFEESARNIDFKSARRWIEDCRARHNDSNISRAFRLVERHLPTGTTSVMRLIDVEKECIRLIAVEGSEAGEHIPAYVALSYRWGPPHLNYTLRQAATEKLQRVGGLRGVAAALPRTIRDAIYLTKRLNFRYLWIDALCIIQDDAVQLERACKMMAWIYSQATVTVVAASGDDSDTGLPGVGSTPRTADPFRFAELRPGSTVARPRDLSNRRKIMDGSSYNTRCWT